MRLGGFDDSWLTQTTITRASVEYFTAQVAAFRRMDDLEGGSAHNLRHARIAVAELTAILKKGSFADLATADRMKSLLAQLAQIAGWMAYDAERHGLAQRYFRTGLQAASEVGDRDLGVHILACMTYQAVHRSQLCEAGDLAEATTRAAKKSHPLVGTVAAVRKAHMYAAAGDLHGFRTATADAAGLFERVSREPTGPDYLYWFDKTVAQTVEGQGLLLLAISAPRGAKSHLEEAERLLASEISPRADVRPRDAAFHRAWLARAHVKKGDLHRGLNLAETAVGRMGAISSPRTRGVLRHLDRDLANLRQGSKLPEVRALRRQLQPVLAA